MPGSLDGPRALVAAALVLCASAAHAADAQVSIDNFSFTPATLTVQAGTKVVFTNRDDIPHTVTSAAQPVLFRSAALDTDEAFAFTFAKPGIYAYFCSLHPHMQATIVVR